MRRLLEHLRGARGAAYGFLSRISPGTYLGIYVLLIPFFAAIYWIAPGQNFYAPYAKLEPSALADASKVAENIQRSLERSYRGQVQPGEGWHVAGSDIGIDRVDADDTGALTFTVSFFATKLLKGEIVQSVGGPQLRVRISEQRIVTQLGQANICHLVSELSGGREASAFAFDFRMLFQAPDPALQAKVICWGGNEELAFEHLLSGWSGNPSELAGAGWRTLYFSAITITTVGFGDIVPLTGLARLLAGIEAVLGWILAGLFLNAIAVSAARTASE